jgi:hypothetical protein
MRVSIIVFVLIFIFCGRSLAQPAIEGTIVDTLENKKLANAIVSIVNAKDSILLKFTRTDQNGHFDFPALAITDYNSVFFIISYPGYADYVISAPRDSALFLLKKVRMITTIHLLQEVVVKQGVKAVRFNKDTVEYKADSFKVELNASVEDLLKKFPGFQIDPNGRIIANGVVVEKVLVDGEEYFSGDPTLVTRNIRADLIDKVQLFDKKSDQAAFTGIDDGKKIRTINLKIKEDRQNTFFGKMGIAAGNGYYNGELMANKFNKKQKLAVFGMASNTGKQSLASQDESRYGDADNSAGYKNTDLLDTWSGNYEGQGYPELQMAGFHYNDKWGDKNQLLNTNYRYVNLGLNGSIATTRSSFLPGSEIVAIQNQVYKNHLDRHVGNVVYDLPIDSVSSLKISLDATSAKKTTRNDYVSRIENGAGTILSDNRRVLSFEGNSRLFNGTVLYRKRFRKKGRTMLLSFTTTTADNQSDGFLNSENSVYTGPGVVKENIDQYKNNANISTAINARVTYTEPLSTTSSITLNNSVVSSQSTSNRNSYNLGTDGKYSVYDSLYSIHYAYNTLMYKPGIYYTYNRQKLRITLGNDLGFTSFHQNETFKKELYNRKFINFYPQVTISMAHLVLSYSGSTTQPTLSQIQPLRSNEDPLNIAIGNPDLRQYFSHSFQASYVVTRTVQKQNFWLQTSYNLIDDAISTSDQFDNSGKRTFRYLNVNGTHSLNTYMQFDFVEKRTKANIAVSATYNNYANVNYINGTKVTTNTDTYIFGSSIQKAIPKKLEFVFRYSATYWTNATSGNNASFRHYWIHNIRPAIDLYLPFKTQFHVDAQLYLMQKTNGFDSGQDLFLVNASYAKKFLKSEALSVKLSVNDLFNTNKGISRVVNATYATQSISNTIMQYFLMSLTYDFVKYPPKK